MSRKDLMKRFQEGNGLDEVQLFSLGVESHDNLVDALVWLVQGLVRQGLDLPEIRWIEA